MRTLTNALAALTLVAVSACSTTQQMTPRETALAGFNALFVDFDAEAAGQLFAEDYIQHNPAVPTGAAPIIAFIPALEESGIKPTIHRVIAEDDMVVLHVTTENAQAFGADTLVGFDVFRIEDGLIAEHWDNLQPPVDASETASGNSMTDGATDITDRARTAENKALVEGFVKDVLQGDAPQNITDYISTENYIQHNPQIDNGLDGLGAALEAMAANGVTMRYDRTPIVVAEGNFVFTASEGEFAGEPTAFFDLFRVEGGKIVEHWDTVATIPPAEDFAHENGKF